MPLILPNPIYLQQESVNPSKPTSEFLNFSMGGTINYLLSRVFPVGSIIPTMLTQPQFLAQLGNPIPSTWVLADGGNALGTLYNQITGHTTLPDLRGIFTRGQGGVNPDGSIPLGTYEADQFGSHNHNFNDPGHSHTFNNPIALLHAVYENSSGLSAYDQTFSNPPLGLNSSGSGLTFNANGGNESRARNLTINWMIRIN